MSFLTRIPGITRINDAVFEEQLSENLVSFFDWGLLGIGGFFNVKRPMAKSKFKPVTTPNFAYGRVWETSKANWVWESGVNYPVQPVPISGVYVNNVFIPKDTGYYLNYPDGQIVFNTALPTNSVVEMEFTHKRFNFYESDTDWFHQVVFDPIPESGVREILAKNRVYLPAVIVEVVGGSRFTGVQLGDYSVFEDQPVLFHIISEYDEDRDKLIRVIKNMNNRTIGLYDTNKVAAANKFPLTLEGSVASGALTYPQMLEQFAWKTCQFANIIPQDITSQLPLFRAVIRANLRVIMP